MTLNPPKRLAINIPERVPMPPGDNLSSEANLIRIYNNAITEANTRNDHAFTVYSLRCRFWQEDFIWLVANRQKPNVRPLPPKAWVVIDLPPGQFNQLVGVFDVVESDKPLAEECPDPIAPLKLKSYIGKHIFGSYYGSLEGDPIRNADPSTWESVKNEAGEDFRFLPGPIGGVYQKKGPSSDVATTGRRYAPVLTSKKKSPKRKAA